MLRIELPQQVLELEHAVFDINGTLALDGILLPGVAERLRLLSHHLSIHALTAGTHGRLAELQQALEISLHVVSTGEDKVNYIRELGAERVVAIGNGANDAGMLGLAKVGIAVLGGEGMAVKTLQAADVMVRGPLDALDLLLHPKRLIATLRL